MGKMKKYDSYKDSGIEWIGQMPDHWGISKIKFLFDIQKGKTPKNLLEKLDVDTQVYLAMDYLRGEPKQTFFVSREENVVEVDEGDTLLLWDGSNAGEFLKSKKGALSSTMAVIKSNIIDFGFQWYSFKNYESILKDSCNGMGIPHVDGKFFRGSAFAIPPIEEQTAIANYLDQKTAQIDDLIAKKERLIQLLEEERTAIINQAVTKGLDPTVPMKDSGIEWLGEIPAHWEVKKLKYFANVVLGKMLTNEDKGGYQLKPYLRAKNIEWIKPNIDDVKEMWFSENEINQFRIKENDLLISEGGEVGRTCIWQNQLEECYIQNSVHKVTIIEGDSNYYLNQFVLFGNYGHFDAIVNKISIAHLTKEKLKDVIFIVPPIDVQFKISKYITSKANEIENIISKSKQEIVLLREYKTALISEVVTGKVDVRCEKLS